MDSLKLPIALVVAMVVQISAGVWWVSQQAQTISQLKLEVEELTAKTAVEEEVNLKRDVEELKANLEDLSNKTLEAIEDVMLDYTEKFDSLKEYIDNANNSQDIISNNNLEKIQNDFNVISGWATEWDVDITELFEEIEKLDKKLSDRIKELK